MARKKSAPAVVLATRAVSRVLNPGEGMLCAGCDGIVQFKARLKLKRIVCNVYAGGRWDRIEVWHPGCYAEAGQPHGEPDTSAELR